MKKLSGFVPALLVALLFFSPLLQAYDQIFIDHVFNRYTAACNDKPPAKQPVERINVDNLKDLIVRKSIILHQRYCSGYVIYPCRC